MKNVSFILLKGNNMKNKLLLMFLLCLLLITSVLASQMPKKVDNFITIKGKTNSSYDAYGQVIFSKNKVFIFGTRLEQNKDYEIVAISGKNITCIKKVKSYPSLITYCDNSFCGYFDYSFNLNKKTSYLKNSIYYIYDYEDIDCKNKKLKNNPILK
jgi:hypothetical protein